MQIDIQSTGFTLTDGIRASLMTRLACDLSHGDDQVTRVIVRLSDINGPRGGVDMRCFIEVRLKHAPSLVIEDTEADLYLAIDRAVERAGRAVERSLARQREFAPGLPKVQDHEDGDAPVEVVRP
ncbi:MAG: 30S ribosomal protein S30 [Thiobacillus sp. SCN 63-374]|nr:MAG: 30S ribosomal protein S30 [Thiobacillus sp. SCN 63-374]